MLHMKPSTFRIFLRNPFSQLHIFIMKAGKLEETQQEPGDFLEFTYSHPPNFRPEAIFFPLCLPPSLSFPLPTTREPEFLLQFKPGYLLVLCFNYILLMWWIWALSMLSANTFIIQYKIKTWVEFNKADRFIWGSSNEIQSKIKGTQFYNSSRLEYNFSRTHIKRI